MEYMSKIWLKPIPSILVGLRFAIAPLLLFDAWDREVGHWTDIT